MNNYFLQTRSIWMAAALRLHGYDYTDLKLENGRVTFVFETPDPEFERIKIRYFNRNLEVNVRKFIDEWYRIG